MRTADRAGCRGAAVALACLILVGAASGCGKGAPPEMGWPPALVTVAPAESRDVPIYIDAIGRCLASETVVLRPLVTGRILKVTFTDGSDVGEGKPLFTIDPAPFEARRDEARARLASANAAVTEAKAEQQTAQAKVATAKSRLEEAAARVTAEDATAAAAKADVEAALAEAVRAAEDLKRQEALVASGSVSGQTIDNARSEAKATEARAEAARRREAAAAAQVTQSKAAADSARHGVAEAESVGAESDARVSTASAAVDEAAAALRTAELQVKWTTVAAPIAGRAGRRLVDAGNVATENDTELVTIHRIDPAYVEFTVIESDLAAVRAASARAASGKETLEASITLPGDPGEPVRGSLSFLDNEVEGETGTLRLRATVANADGRCWPGRFARVRLVLETRTGAVLVPEGAPQVGPTGMFLYVVVGDAPATKAELRPVVVGQKHGDMVLVEGVKPGERVVTKGQVGVRPGGPVVVVEPQPAPGGGAPPK